jgi:hypothetical protein
MLSGLGPSFTPHAEQICDVGAQRSSLTTWRPCCAAFSSSRRTKIAQPASWTDFAAVGDRDAMPAFLPVARALLLAGQCPLGSGQPPLGGAKMPWVGDLLGGAVAGGDRGEPGEAKVDPGGPVHHGQWCGVAIDDERGVVAAVRLADDGDAGRHRRQVAGPAHPHLADLGQVQPAAVEGEAVAGEPDRLAAVLGPEPRGPDRWPLRLPTSERLPLPGGRVDAVAVPDQHTDDFTWPMRQDDDRRGRHVVSASNVQLVVVTRDRRGADRRAVGHTSGVCAPTSAPSWSRWTVRTTTCACRRRRGCPAGQLPQRASRPVGCASATGCAPTGRTCGRRRTSPRRLVAPGWEC